MTELSSSVRAFISHSGEDNDRFALRFAERLRENGIDAWLDRWEMNLGDNLIEKIYDEGLKDTDVIILVVSVNSLKSNWVKDELYTAKVKQIMGSCRVMSVLLDNCSIPEPLRASLYTEIDNTESYDSQFDEIVRSVYGRYERPALGPPPRFVESASQISGIDLADSHVLKLACEQARENGKGSRQSSAEQIMVRAGELGITENAVRESLEVLSEQYYIYFPDVVGGRQCGFFIYSSGWDAYSRAYVPDYVEFLRNVAARIENEGMLCSTEIAEALGRHHMDVYFALEWLKDQGYIKTTQYLGNGYETEVWKTSASLKRWLRDA